VRKIADYRLRLYARVRTQDARFLQAFRGGDGRGDLRAVAMQTPLSVLAKAALAGQKLGLKLWDCYRPLSVQRKFWALVPDARYVANPAKGSRHNRGAAVDLTLVDATGRELDMGTAFDDFSERAHRDARDVSEAARGHRATLEAAMAAEGFLGMPTEWWHFDYGDWRKYPIADVPLDGK